MHRLFIPSADQPSERREPAWWFIFLKGRLLVSGEGDRLTIPLSPGLEDLGLDTREEIFLGTLGERPCYAAVPAQGASAPAGMTFLDLRQVYGRVAHDLIPIAFRGLHLLHWSQKTRYCGQCGMKMRDKAELRAKECPGCGNLSFPRISPAVIVLVERGDRCLLACSPRFKDGFYSTLAGFAEPGETLEEVVEREVREETGIEVKDIRYFGSQPWPFPDSLMVGFTAQYAGGEILVDGTEISDAQWFSFDRLPKIPGKISIARSLIDWFVTKHQSKEPEEERHD
ncbi:MAG: NAD(+) diphosphatase [Deltaproteobacteria bacterium]|nr:NAD(+) diphosphatase [Deltaproteobacteria bacterium]